MNDAEKREPPELAADKLLVFRYLWHDGRRPDAGIVISGILTELDQTRGVTVPFRFERLFVYFQVWGDAGEYLFRIRLVRLESSEVDGNLEDVQLGVDGEPLEFMMPTVRRFEISGLNYVDVIAFPIHTVPFETAGLYEFQVWADGVDRPLARDRIRVQE